jgi:phenylpyruvate tautomerase PptA (4-oxalocrotonate tautomerase family)
MPLLKLQTSVSVPQDKRAELLGSLSKLIGHAIGKPEQYVMVTIEEGPILMSGKDGPAAFADVRSIGGLDGNVNREISQNLCVLLNKTLGISANRVYLNFTDVAPGNWGWNSSTFG